MPSIANLPFGRLLTLRWQLSLLSGVIAVASVAITGVTAVGLYHRGVQQAASENLRREAEIVAAALADSPPTRQRAGQVSGRRYARWMRARKIEGLVLDRETGTIVISTADGAPPLAIEADDLAALRTDSTVSTSHPVGDEEWLVEGAAAGPTLAIVVAQPMSDARAAVLGPLSSLVVPLLLGVAGGVGAGLLLASRISHPLSRLAKGARMLGQGRRQIPSIRRGPVEVRELGRALDDFARALDASEARQKTFLMHVSHELRTPLTSVAGYAELLADGGLPEAEIRRAGRVIGTEAGRLHARVSDLLALARMEADDFPIDVKPVDLATIVESVESASQARAASARIELRAEVPDVGLVVSTDGERVRQALDALVDNAIRILPEGGTVTVAASLDRAGWARVEVRDDGPGLAADDIAVAFERGLLSERYRGRRPVGSGLGLALVAQLAERLGGRAVAAVAPEGGAAFALLLPTTGPATNRMTRIDSS
ncbi:MAG: sensor histidine kinase [Nocardioides sp.]